MKFAEIYNQINQYDLNETFDTIFNYIVHCGEDSISWGALILIGLHSIILEKNQTENDFTSKIKLKDNRNSGIQF